MPANVSLEQTCPDQIEITELNQHYVNRLHDNFCTIVAHQVNPGLQFNAKHINKLKKLILIKSV